MGVSRGARSAGGWLTGRWRKGQDAPDSTRASAIPQRYDLSLPGEPAQARRRRALAQLAEEAGMSLIHLALAFVLQHPAVTAAIIGPRTMEQLESQLGAADVRLDARRARPHRRDRPAGHDLHARRRRAGRRPRVADASLRRR